jgi:hypothetical protein
MTRRNRIGLVGFNGGEYHSPEDAESMVARREQARIAAIKKAALLEEAEQQSKEFRLKIAAERAAAAAEAAPYKFNRRTGSPNEWLSRAINFSSRAPIKNP